MVTEVPSPNLDTFSSVCVQSCTHVQSLHEETDLVFSKGMHLLLANLCLTTELLISGTNCMSGSCNYCSVIC